MPNLLLPDNETQIIKAGDGSARKLIKRFKADDYVLADNEHTFAFTCKAQIDLSGDGKEKIPSSGPLSLEGDMKPVGMDL